MQIEITNFLDNRESTFSMIIFLLPIIILLALLTSWPSMQIKHPSIPSLQPFPQ